ncbi:MAG: CPBP family intramembrane glutamic endopeptidase [Bacteroidales bacterium]|nr:CPBP family intramembrane glutamic endopeptidase [Tenuifilaceae bacterium]
MNKFLINPLSPVKGIIASMLLALMGFLIFLLVGILLNSILFGGLQSGLDTMSNLSSPQGLMSMRIMQVCQTTGLFLFPALAIAFFSTSKIYNFLGLKRLPARLVVVSILIMVAFIPAVNLIASLNAKIPMPGWMLEMERAATELTKAMLMTDQLGLMLLNFFVVAIMPAVAEELFFRGLIQKYLVRWTKRTIWGVVIAAFIFSAIHMQFQGFIPRFLLGMLFGYLYVWSGSIWAPIAAHMANNGIAVVLYYLIAKGVVPSQVDTVGNISDMWQLGIASLAIVSSLIWLFRQKTIKLELLQAEIDD